MAGAVGESPDDGNGAAGDDLAGEHEFQALAHFILHEGHDAEEVLHGVAETQAVALAVVDHGGVA